MLSIQGMFPRHTEVGVDAFQYFAYNTIYFPKNLFYIPYAWIIYYVGLHLQIIVYCAYTF